MHPLPSAIADQFEELARWIKPMPRAMILLRQRLEEQGKRVEALDVHLMTLLQEVEVKANPPTKAHSVKGNTPTEIRSLRSKIGNGSALSVKAAEVLLTAALTALLLHFSLSPVFRSTPSQPPSPQQPPVEQPKEK